jgi:NAD(P)-dependent dehydrogenase (short-subunit alcohol dehydrogenase family)
MCTIIILKYLYKKNPVAIFLMMIFIPLLFIQSQSNIFEYFTNQNKNCYQNLKSNLNKSRFDNKVIAITGCSSGIGQKLSLWLTNKTNATIICLNRNNINNVDSKRKIYINCDLTDFSSVKKAYKKIKSLFTQGVDILINNAGITNSSNSNTKDGYNDQIQTNYISHALLSELFIRNHNKNDENKKKPLEIIYISSLSFNIPNNKFDQTFFGKNNNLDGTNITNMYNSHLCYQQSKLAMLLYSNHMNKKMLNKKSNIKIYCLHPGICKTGLFEKSNLPFFIKSILKCFTRTLDFPCEFITTCLSNENVYSGDFYGINFMNNSINKIENEDLINDESSNELYKFTQTICDNII